MPRSYTPFLGALCAGFIAATSAFGSCFDNAQVQNLALHNKHKAKSENRASDTGSLIYVWSPRMVLSLQEAHVAAQAAQQRGLDFLPLHDARLPEDEWRQALQSARAQHPAAAQALQASMALCASDLIERDALRHFPTAFVVTTRGTHRFAIVGAMPQSAWQLSISERLRP